MAQGAGHSRCCGLELVFSARLTVTGKFFQKTLRCFGGGINGILKGRGSAPAFQFMGTLSLVTLQMRLKALLTKPGKYPAVQYHSRRRSVP